MMDIKATNNAWIYFVALLLPFGFDVTYAVDPRDDWSICTKPTCKDVNPPNGSFVDDCNLHEGYKLVGHCCKDLSTGIIVGVDLSYCKLKTISGLLRSQAPDVIRVNLTHNPDLKLENETFEGLTKLRTLVIDGNLSCPGQWNWYNTTWKAWHEMEGEKHQTKCINQTDTCSKLYKTHNYTCPDNSDCVNDGPGHFLCECNKGWGGYRCLRETGKDLKIPILSGTAACAVVLASFLWFTQRRHII